MSDDLVIGADRRARCGWGASTPDYERYHDEEWGKPVRDADALYEKLCLEAFQSGLSWLTILRKREAFRAAFAGFDIAAVARFGPDDVERLMGDPGIVRNRGKIEAAIANAKAAAEVEDLRPGPRRPPGAADDGGGPGGHARVDRARQGAQAARLPLRRPDHGVRAHAGVRAGERSRRGMLGALRVRTAGIEGVGSAGFEGHLHVAPIWVVNVRIAR
jgi:hypothetical protein